METATKAAREGELAKIKAEILTPAPEFQEKFAAAREELLPVVYKHGPPGLIAVALLAAEMVAAG